MNYLKTKPQINILVSTLNKKRATTLNIYTKQM
jgi:hypothetical protein